MWGWLSWLPVWMTFCINMALNHKELIVPKFFETSYPKGTTSSNEKPPAANQWWRYLSSSGKIGYMAQYWLLHGEYFKYMTFVKWNLEFKFINNYQDGSTYVIVYLINYHYPVVAGIYLYKLCIISGLLLLELFFLPATSIMSYRTS